MTKDAARLRSWLGEHRPFVDIVAYLVAAVVAAAIGVTGLWSVFSLVGPGVSPWWSLVTAVPAICILFARDRYPLAALVAATAVALADVLTFGGLLPLFVVIDTLYVATRDASQRRRRGILFAIVVTVAVGAVASFAVIGNPAIAAIVGVQIGGIMGSDYWYATSVAQSRELVALHRRRAEDAEALAERARESAVQNEREDMARELHDLVAGHVSAMVIRTEASLGSPPDADRDRAALRAVRDSGLDAHEALRSMIAVLRAGSDVSGRHTALAPPRRASLPAIVAASRRSGLRVQVRDEIDGPLADPVDQAVGRIVQEALANCLRHAAGARVDVHLFEERQGIAVRVESREGRSLPHPALEGSGWGIELIRERARALGGELEAGPRGEGWCVHARLPREVHL